MKLAEALIIRSDLHHRFSKLKERLNRSSQVQEGENPPEDPASLLRELDEVTAQLLEIIQRINRTNSRTMITDDTSLADLLAIRDHLMQKRKALNSLLDSASSLVNRYSRSEIKILSTIQVPDLQKQVDDLSKQARETDVKIQEQNWLIDLL